MSIALLICACKVTECLLPCLAVFGVQAQAVTLTVAQAFKVALDLWEVAQEGEVTAGRLTKSLFPFLPMESCYRRYASGLFILTLCGQSGFLQESIHMSKQLRPMFPLDDSAH